MVKYTPSKRKAYEEVPYSNLEADVILSVFSRLAEKAGVDIVGLSFLPFLSGMIDLCIMLSLRLKTEGVWMTDILNPEIRFSPNQYDFVGNPQTFSVGGHSRPFYDENLSKFFISLSKILQKISAKASSYEHIESVFRQESLKSLYSLQNLFSREVGFMSTSSEKLKSLRNERERLIRLIDANERKLRRVLGIPANTRIPLSKRKLSNKPPIDRETKLSGLWKDPPT